MSDSTTFKAAAPTGRLSSVPLLSQLDAASLADLETRLKWLSVPGGSTLFREGEVADALYVVIVGCLAVTVRGSDGHDVLVACSRAGDTVGEMGLLGGELRSASVTALRDSELLRLEKSSFDWLVERHPRSMLSIASQLAQRLRRPRTAPARDWPSVRRARPVEPISITTASLASSPINWRPTASECSSQSESARTRLNGSTRSRRRAIKSFITPTRAAPPGASCVCARRTA